MVEYKKKKIALQSGGTLIFIIKFHLMEKRNKCLKKNI